MTSQTYVKLPIWLLITYNQSKWQSFWANHLFHRWQHTNTFFFFHMSMFCYVVKRSVGRYLPMTICLQCTCTPYKSSSIQNSYTWFAQVWTQNFLKASQCLCNQATQHFVNKTCVTKKEGEMILGWKSQTFWIQVQQDLLEISKE